jgi:F0F1-type ATP synthase alpha subunit
LNRGKNIFYFFDQSYTLSTPVTIQLILFALIWSDYLNGKTKDEIHLLRSQLISAYEKNPETKAFFDKLLEFEKVDQFVPNITANLTQILQACKTEG